MIPINFSYRKSKRNYIFSKKSNNKCKILVKKINIYIILAIFIFINVFSISIVEAKSTNVTYTQKLTNGIDSFPESYQKLLRQLIDETLHSNWNFQAYYTGIDWNDFVSGEKEYNRVYQGFDVAHRCSCNNWESGYYCANSEITSYFMDPRNFITERNIFQFLEISYNKDIYTEEIIKKLVSQYAVFNHGNPITFIMSDENHSSYNKEVTMTYTDIIMKASETSQMSPISMVIKIVQEVGASGSASTDGKHEQYPNTYNFFNIGSSDEGDAILNGLSYANNKGWHCPYTSIVEGAVFNSDNYIKAGQNTAYFYKYDCVGTKILKAGETQTITSRDLYHQYMTNVQDPYSQSASLFNTYLNNELLDENLNFIIPIFENMPSEPVDKISSLSNSDKELYYADITSSLYIRNAPSSSSGILDTIYKDDLVVMLHRNHSNSGGNSWDMVQLWDGDIGYTMSKYLEPYVPNTSSGKDNSNTGNSSSENSENPGNSGDPGNSSGSSNNNVNVDNTPLIHKGYGYADVSTTLNVRKGAGTSYAVQDSLVGKQEFVILEETDNWCKIKYDDKTGYVSKDYVKTLEYIKVDEEKKEITIIPNITANMVAGKINAESYSVKNGDKDITNNSLGTGYVIKLDDDEYTLLKVGDVNGDSNVNSGDLLAIQKHLLKISLIDKDITKYVADTNYDNNINSGDLLTIQKYLLKVSKIVVNN